MKLIVEQENGCVKAIKIEYTPSEALLVNHAMRRYTCDEEVNAENRADVEKMLDVKPIFVDISGKGQNDTR